MGAAGAQNVKSFDLLNVSLTGSTVSAEFKNLDNGNSTFNAARSRRPRRGHGDLFERRVKADGVTVSASNVFLQDSNTKLVVTSLSPVKKSKSVVITATVNVAIGAGQCAPSIEWQGSAWTGSVSSPSQVFSQANANRRPASMRDASSRSARCRRAWFAAARRSTRSNAA
jgi:hypothetical protein